MTIDVKICGLRTPECVDAAVRGGARFVGFVFFRGSPRYVEPEVVHDLASRCGPVVGRVGLVVDAPDDDLERIITKSGVNMLQLHGSETPERVAAIKQQWGLPVIKSIAIADTSDLQSANRYEAVADRLLFDARPPRHATRPGGNAVSFDWRLLRSCKFRVPWILAGGLSQGNLAEAVGASGAAAVDVSSGVEDKEGTKSIALISEFLSLASTLPAAKAKQDLLGAPVGK